VLEERETLQDRRLENILGTAWFRDLSKISPEGRN